MKKKFFLSLAACILLALPIAKGNLAEDIEYYSESGFPMVVDNSVKSNVKPNKHIHCYIDPMNSSVFYNGREVFHDHTFEVALADEEVQNYPKLAAALKEESRRRIIAFGESSEPAMYEMADLASRNPAYPITGTKEQTFTLLRSDNKVFSYRVLDYTFLGGAHPYMEYSAKTFDSKSGKELSLKEVITDTNKLASAVYDELMLVAEEERWDQNMNDNLLEMIQKRIKEKNLAWGLGEYGLYVFFGDYQLGAYAVGCQTVFVPYRKYPDLVKTEFIYSGLGDKPINYYFKNLNVDNLPQYNTTVISL